MNAPARLAVYVVALAGVFAAGLGIGTAVGPESDDPAPVTTVVEHPPGHDGAHS